jgi:hypothetical protein
MKSCHLQWIPQKLTVAQQFAREEVAKAMLVIIAMRVASNFHFLFTGDEQ